jgi:catechol 2,3-dioxygenase-like lactoylglutathione lyase family enzyme
MHVERLTHVGICVSDLERSLRFYRDVLGCKEVGRLEMEGGTADVINEMTGVRVQAIYLERDGWRLELIAFPAPGTVGPKTPRPMNQLGLTHLSLRVDDLEAVCARLEAAGGGLLPATRIGGPDAPVHVIMAHDPDGTRLELIQGPGDPNALPGSPGYLVGD